MGCFSLSETGNSEFFLQWNISIRNMLEKENRHDTLVFGIILHLQSIKVHVDQNPLIFLTCVTHNPLSNSTLLNNARMFIK